MQHHDDRDRDDERHRVQHRVGHAEQVERLLEQVRHRRFADAAQQDRADGDAELRPGQHHRQILAGPDHRHRAVLALFGQGFQPVAARRDQRELRADEERVGRQQQHGQQHAEEVTHQRRPRFLRARRPSLVSSSRSIRRPSIRTTRGQPAHRVLQRAVGIERRQLDRLALLRGCGRAPAAPGRRWSRIRLPGARNPVASATSSMRSSPDTCQPSPGLRRTSACASSCSSRMSPTISSITSSTVTMPAVPPYSSTTSAVCRPLARSCAITSSPSRVDGTLATGCARPASRVRWPFVGRHLEDLLDVDDARWSRRGRPRRSGTASSRSGSPRPPDRRRCRRPRAPRSSVRGVISSSAVREPNCSERSTSVGGDRIQRPRAGPSCGPASRAPAASAPTAAPRPARCPAGAGSSWRCRWSGGSTG